MNMSQSFNFLDLSAGIEIKFDHYGCLEVIIPSWYSKYFIFSEQELYQIL